MITAIVLAAGQSRRMGQAKINLPWGGTTVLGKIISTLMDAGIEDISIVTGSTSITGLLGHQKEVLRLTNNPDSHSSGMLTSLQVGLQDVPGSADAILVVLGDQPQIEASVVQAILRDYVKFGGQILIPSYQNRRGHPVLIDRSLWPVILEMGNEGTLRDFISGCQDKIRYIEVDTESVLQDLDTPDDYERFKPESCD